MSINQEAKAQFLDTLQRVKSQAQEVLDTYPKETREQYLQTRSDVTPQLMDALTDQKEKAKLFEFFNIRDQIQAAEFLATIFEQIKTNFDSIEKVVAATDPDGPSFALAYYMYHMGFNHNKMVSSGTLLSKEPRDLLRRRTASDEKKAYHEKNEARGRRNEIVAAFVEWIRIQYEQGSRDLHSNLVKMGLKQTQFKDLKDMLKKKIVGGVQMPAEVSKRRLLSEAAKIARPYGCVRGDQK
jgi:hypothetical protein